MEALLWIRLSEKGSLIWRRLGRAHAARSRAIATIILEKSLLEKRNSKRKDSELRTDLGCSWKSMEPLLKDVR